MATFTAQRLTNGNWGVVSSSAAPRISFRQSAHLGNLNPSGVPARVQLTIEAMNLAYQRSSTFRNFMLQHRKTEKNPEKNPKNRDTIR